MTTQGEYRNGRYVGPAETKSVVVNIDRNQGGPTFPVFRFPAAGYVQKAFIFSEFSTAGTSLQASLLNGGIDGAGTVVMSPISSGTLLSGSAYMLTIDPFGAGPEAYAEGQIVMVKLTGGGNPAADIQVQVDYALDPAPGPLNSPVSPPGA